MCGHSPLCGLVVVLLAFGVCCLSISPPRSEGAPSPGRTSSSAAISQARSDLDGDGLVDLVRFDPGTLTHYLELHLSRTNERMVLPFSATVGGHGALSAQDLDGDGDIDLLWQGSLPPYAVRIWLNEGAGRFECLCPAQSGERSFALGGPGVNAAHAHHPVSALSPERYSSPGEVLTARGDCHVAAPRALSWPEPLGIVSGLQRLLSTRGPPLSLC